MKMQNLKIKVNTAEESKEVQELLFELGYEWYSHGKTISYLDAIATNDFGYLVAWKTGCFSKHIIQMGCGKEDAKETTLAELRGMVNQEQDEPFLTPETTLNEQYAEIEEVRQAEIHGTVKAKPDFNFGAAQAIGRAKDNVNHPNHYTQGKVECIDALESATIGKSGIEAVCVANIIKYLWRYEEKNGLEDIKKANFYLNRLIATLENNNG